MMLLNTPAPSLPIGVILPYVGLVADIPTGWALCDGQNGTVDMRNKFVMGGDHAAIGNTGGANEVTPSGSVNVTVNNHTLSASQMPSHGHYQRYRPTGSGQTYQYGSAMGRVAGLGLTNGSGTTSNAGSSGSHGHGVSSSMSMNQQDNKPAYYQTAYIQRVA